MLTTDGDGNAVSELSFSSFLIDLESSLTDRIEMENLQKISFFLYFFSNFELVTANRWNLECQKKNMVKLSLIL